jgi:hydrogenase assembly chaperone HypC/HupF
MCLSIPVLITKIENKEAEADIGGISRHISLLLTPEAKVGDYVLCCYFANNNLVNGGIDVRVVSAWG